MLKNCLFAGMIFLNGSLLLGCNMNTYPTQGERVYVDSYNGPALVVPQPLSDREISHFHDIPQPNRDHVQVSIVPIDQ